jgi:hypothetical protein
MSNSASTAASWQAAVEAEFDRQYALDQQKRNKEFEESISAEVANLPSNPSTGGPTRFSRWEGGATKKRTTRTKKMKRRHTRKPRRSKHSLKLKHQYKK